MQSHLRLHLHINDPNAHQRKLETNLSSILYWKHMRNLEVRDLNLLEK